MWSLLLLGLACGAAAGGQTRPLPAYAGRATELFDDALEPRAVGLDPNAGAAPRSDARLRERTQVADAVLRVRVSTLTVRSEETGSSFVLGLRTLEHLTGPHPPPSDFVLRADRSTPSAGILRTLQTRVVGMTLVAFVRAFVRPDGDAEWHFHLVPDTKDFVSAVKEAATLAELK